MKVAQPIPGFYNGVSQQPAAIRLPTQCDYQENALSSLVQGLIKRPNTEHLAHLNTPNLINCFFHLINRDITEQYIILGTGNNANPIEVYTIDGEPCTVRYGRLTEDLAFSQDDSVKSYVQVSDPSTQLRAVTIADYTFIVNTQQVISLTGDTAPGDVHGSVQTFSKLPPKRPDTVPDGDTTTYAETGWIYEVSGDSSNKFQGYFVKFDGSVWREVPKPGIKIRINGDTMPHKLVRTGYHEFTFSPIGWDNRDCGDDTTCPVPSFVTHTISNLFFFRNRLGFLSRDNIVMSKAGSYFDFWITTATDSMDDDPIDIAATSKEVSYLRASAVFNKELLLFSDSRQFVLSTGDQLLTSKTAALTESTAFDFLQDSEPASVGATCFFISPKAQDTAGTGSSRYVAVREYYVQPSSLTDDAADITSHIPELIPHGVIRLVSCNAMNMLFVRSDDSPNTLYVYSYYWQGQEKVQSSWSYWTFNGDIVGMDCIGNSLYIVINRWGQVHLEKIRLERVVHGNLDFRVHLDRLDSLTGSFDGTYTTWTLPYYETWPIKVIDPDTGLEVLNTTRPSATTIQVKGNKAGKAYLIGTPYKMRFKLSQWYIRDSKNAAIINGKLAYTSFVLAFNETGYFTVVVSGAGRDSTIQEFNPKVLGRAVIGTTPLATGTQKFSIRGATKNLSIEIQNDSHLPSEFQTGSFEGVYTNTNRMI